MTTISEAETTPGWHKIPMESVNGVVGRHDTLWCPTFRIPFMGNGNPGNSREKNTVFWRGVKEKISLRTTTNTPVRWRRIVFESPAPPNPDFVPPGLYTAYTLNPLKGAIPEDNDQAGTPAHFRPFRNVDGTAITTLYDVLFKGTYQTDWSDAMVAATDSSQLKILSDRTYHIRNPADNGSLQTFNLWHPLNKNMSYIGDEFGATIDGVSGFASGKRGSLGNVFIFDMFDWVPLAEPGDMWINSDACVYWHER